MNKKTIQNINFFSSEKIIKNIHFIGIGGVGMGGVALILLKLGYKISGSELINNSITKKLTKLGAIINFEHSEKNIKKAELIIKSSAIPENNLEIVAAKKLNIIVLLRAEMIQILMKFKSGIAISGTHGKTTTTSMIVDIFTSMGLDITFINGGLIKSINSHAKIGLSPWFIVEADESDSSFLHFRPKIAVVTNIEPEHMENYHHDYNKLKKTFLKFLQNIPLSGTSVICIDNPSICDILPYIKCKKITYGFNKHADIRICKYKQKKFTGQFTLNIKNEKKIDIILNMPGQHNALNSAAAVAVAFSVNSNLSFHEIILCLKNFQGTVRRFENIGSVLIPTNNLNNEPTILIDDYGHHPTELSETIKTIRISWPKKCLIMIFEPHRYTRTYTLYYDFIKILTTVDILFLLNIYSANEKFYPKINSQILCKDIKKLKKNYVQFVENPRLILDYLTPKLTGNDIILTQGAGSIEKIAQKILINYKKM